MKMSIEGYEMKVTQEFDHEDVTIQDLINGFKTLCIGMTFSEDQFIDGLKDYLESW